MENKKSGCTDVRIAVTVIVFGIFGVFMTIAHHHAASQRDEYRKALIEAGLLGYNSQTGALEWIEKKGNE